MRPLSILLLCDDRPGHYHLAEGVAAAIARRRPVAVTRLPVARRWGVPGRFLARMLNRGAPPPMVLRVGYGLSAASLPRADLVISAGGETLAANVAAARALGVPNIFCGTLRRLPPDAFALVVSSYARHASLPRHLVSLKPNGIDPDSLQRAVPVLTTGTGSAPAVAGLLIGGDPGFFHYTDAEWQRLARFLEESHAALGTRWIVSTSRRSPDAVADAVLELSHRPAGPIAEFIDFRTAGPGTLPRLFAGVEAILATEDSSTMISEAVCARLPVVGVAPADHGFKDEEREYRAFMRDRGWARFLPLEQLDPPTFLRTLHETRPLAGNHLDELAVQLADRLPQLFA